MSLLSYTELVEEIVNAGVLNAPIENVNPSSIDVRLGNTLLIQDLSDVVSSTIDLADKQTIPLIRREMDESGYVIWPGEFLLASTLEWFDLSKRNDLAGGFKLKSSVARSGLEHLYAAHIDAGWSGNLTLELVNVSRFPLRIKPGMKIGQILWTRHQPVPDHAMYNAPGKGQYCGQVGATASRGIQ